MAPTYDDIIRQLLSQLLGRVGNMTSDATLQAFLRRYLQGTADAGLASLAGGRQSEQSIDQLITALRADVNSTGINEATRAATGDLATLGGLQRALAERLQQIDAQETIERLRDAELLALSQENFLSQLEAIERAARRRGGGGGGGGSSSGSAGPGDLMGYNRSETQVRDRTREIEENIFTSEEEMESEAQFYGYLDRLRREGHGEGTPVFTAAVNILGRHRGNTREALADLLAELDRAQHEGTDDPWLQAVGPEGIDVMTDAAVQEQMFQTTLTTSDIAEIQREVERTLQVTETATSSVTQGGTGRRGLGVAPWLPVRDPEALARGDLRTALIGDNEMSSDARGKDATQSPRDDDGGPSRWDLASFGRERFAEWRAREADRREARRSFLRDYAERQGVRVGFGREDFGRAAEEERARQREARLDWRERAARAYLDRQAPAPLRQGLEPPPLILRPTRGQQADADRYTALAEAMGRRASSLAEQRAREADAARYTAQAMAQRAAQARSSTSGQRNAPKRVATLPKNIQKKAPGSTFRRAI